MSLCLVTDNAFWTECRRISSIPLRQSECCGECRGISEVFSLNHFFLIIGLLTCICPNLFQVIHIFCFCSILGGQIFIGVVTLQFKAKKVQMYNLTAWIIQPCIWLTAVRTIFLILNRIFMIDLSSVLVQRAQTRWINSYILNSEFGLWNLVSVGLHLNFILTGHSSTHWRSK